MCSIGNFEGTPLIERGCRPRFQVTKRKDATTPINTL